MIFVTVGTHEQPFNRLISHIDTLKKNDLITENFTIQTGYSTYIPQYCTWQKLYPYQTMIQNIKDAHIVITHGGPSSFLMALQMGKIPIVVPRQKQFGEHVNDHQLTFCRAVKERKGNIILVEDITKLGEIITQYDTIAASMPDEMKSNNASFNMEFKKLVDEIIRK